MNRDDDDVESGPSFRFFMLDKRSRRNFMLTGSKPRSEQESLTIHTIEHMCKVDRVSAFVC